MRTTLDVADDVLQAAKEIAAREHSTAGAVLSQLARKGLLGNDFAQKEEIKNGIPVFSARPGEVVTLEHVAKLMDDEGV